MFSYFQWKQNIKREENWVFLLWHVYKLREENIPAHWWIIQSIYG